MPATADVAVIGAGLIGLCSALALADRGLHVFLFGEPRPGESSPAGAGILGPSLEDTFNSALPPAVHQFAIASRDRYVDFVADLTERSGISVPLNRLGVLEVASNEAEADLLRARRHGQWLDASGVAALEPGLAPVRGGMYYGLDGAVDNVALLRALRQAADCVSPIHRIADSVVRIGLDGGGVTCTTTNDGGPYHARSVVLAAGAWVGMLAGLPRPLPIEPLRGQMFAIHDASTARLRRVVYGATAYMVPRGDRILIGATVERAGFDPVTTDAGLAELRRGATALWPAAQHAGMTSAWAGLRPATPDLLPIIGVDPQYPALVYACGHSRNGILMAPLTGDCVAAIIAGDTPPVDIGPFAVERFPGAVPGSR